MNTGEDVSENPYRSQGDDDRIELFLLRLITRNDMRYSTEWRKYMLKNVLNMIIVIIVFLNGLLFIATSLYTLGNRELSLQIHEDIPSTASDGMIQFKVILCLLVGILYVMLSYSVVKKKYTFAFAGIVSFILFDGFYMLEFFLWSKTHPEVFRGFLTFGLLNFLIGISSWFYWQKRKDASQAQPL
jgi:hypothetical protein